MSVVHAGRGSRSRYGDLVFDLTIAVCVFVVSGAVGALIWNGVVDLPRFTRDARGASMSAVELSGLFALDGWFAMIGAVIAFVAAVALLVLRHREPVWMVLVIGATSMLGAWLMEQFGRLLGPADPAPILRAAKVGASAPVRLAISSPLYLFGWLAGSVLGMVVVLLFVTPRERSKGEGTRADRGNTDARGPDFDSAHDRA